MPSCSLKHCSSRRNKNQPQLSVHSFPKSNVTHGKWLKAIGEENINTRHKELRLRSLHFEESQLNRTLNVENSEKNDVQIINTDNINVVQTSRSPNPLNPDHEDSEREEGEIVDELDELSDISSEEEFLLRQRLHMLEKYNNVLERKNAKRTTVVSEPGKKAKSNDAFLCDLSEISASELEESYVDPKDVREQKSLKSYPKPKRRKDPPIVNNVAKRVHRKKSNKSKKKAPVLSESSDESDDEYRNKRRKLAVAVNKGNVDKTSLKARLEKMLCVAQNPESERFFPNLQSESPHDPTMNEFCLEKIHDAVPIEVEKDDNQTEVYESVDLCSDVDTKDSGNNGSAISEPSADIKNNGTVVNLPSESYDTVDSVQNATANVENVTVDETQNNKDSDEDLELLRAHALKTKIAKSNSKSSGLDKQNKEQNNIIEEKDALMLSGDEDSDTAELRLICLKSALLKKAFERKQKQKLRKRLSQSLNLNDELMRDQIEYMNQISDNNTDIESVDMDIVSDGDEKSKDSLIESLKPTNIDYEKVHSADSNKDDLMKLIIPVEDEFEEDEDLLRAKLLTSLSKNLPNLVHPNVMNSIKDSELPKTDKETEKQANNVPEEKRFIITIGNSDSEGEHEATKNLTKMHTKLSDQQDFQQKLDLFLKSTRMEVEKSVLPDVVQQPLVPPLPKTKEKFVPKTVNHLPKSEQIEYKNLVKRMAELEKIKNARQSSINLVNKGVAQQKDTLKPRNFGTRDQATNKDLEEQIAMSRKTIAEESAKVLKLKEEATKLSHKYKIVSTELRNLATAMTLNKKQQKVAQIKLSKIRTQHQLLINSSTTSKHSLPNGNLGTMVRNSQKLTSSSKRPQKENAPLKEAAKGVPYSQSTISDLQSVQVSVVNDLMEEQNPRLSVQIDVTNNKKTVKLPNNPVKNSVSVENSLESRIDDGRSIDARETLDRGKCKKDSKELNNSNWGSKHKIKDDDYKSPLQALGSANWEDPNAVLCRFEVGGNCKDPDCKFLHPKIQEQ